MEWGPPQGILKALAEWCHDMLLLTALDSSKLLLGAYYSRFLCLALRFLLLLASLERLQLVSSGGLQRASSLRRAALLLLGCLLQPALVPITPLGYGWWIPRTFFVQK